jgi:hypothetical protein
MNEEDQKEKKQIEIKDDGICHGFNLLDVFGIIFVVVLLLAFAR